MDTQRTAYGPDQIPDPALLRHVQASFAAAPLITKDELEKALYTSQGPIADAVLVYLRAVLTPAALSMFEEHTDGSLGSKDGGEEYDAGWLTNGKDLHRRIFGENE